MPDASRHRCRLQRAAALAAALTLLLQAIAWSGMVSIQTQPDLARIAVCTRDGIRWIAVSGSDAAAESGPAGWPAAVPGNHCDLCVFAAGLGQVPARLSLFWRAGFWSILQPDPVLPLPFVAVRGPQQPRAPPCS